VTAPQQAEAVRPRVPVRALPGRLLTVLLLLPLGRATVAGHRHVPIPDLLRPGTCNVCFLALGDRVHRWRQRRPRGRHGLGAEKAGWR
jgi:hypothetical protein